MVFTAGVGMLGDANPSTLDLALLVLASIVCVALLFRWRRAPETFVLDPELGGQLLTHGLAIIVVALSTRALALFTADWVAATAVAVASLLCAAALSLDRFQQSTEALWRYARMSLASVSLMGSIAAAVLFSQSR